MDLERDQVVERPQRKARTADASYQIGRHPVNAHRGQLIDRRTNRSDCRQRLNQWTGDPAERQAERLVPRRTAHSARLEKGGKIWVRSERTGPAPPPIQDFATAIEPPGSTRDDEPRRLP